MSKEILVTGGTGSNWKIFKKILPDANYVGSKDYNLLDLIEVQKMFLELNQKNYSFSCNSWRCSP